MKRKVIIHYHLFKNAGTSIDKMLAESFGEQWIAWDNSDPNAKIFPADMETFILDHPDILAVSSHQALLPLPDKHLDVYPIVFIRHPIDRAYSAYLFEWGIQKGAEAPIGSFDDYILENFQRPRRNTIEDFQTLRLSNQSYEFRRPPATIDDEEVLGYVKTMLMSLPCFGLVDDYEGSLARIHRKFGKAFPQLVPKVFRENSLQDPAKSIYEKIREIRNSLRPDVLSQLILRNQMDLRLYEFADSISRYATK